jgi:hypothetical protein
MLILANDLGGRETFFESVEVAATVEHNDYAMPYENDLKVFLCRGLKQPLAELWPQLQTTNDWCLKSSTRHTAPGTGAQRRVMDGGSETW